MSDQKTNSVYSESKPRLREARASSCGKAIIIGEHAVVYGSKAVAMPLKQLRMQIQLKPLPCNHEDHPNYHLILGGKDVSKRVADVIPDTFHLLTNQPASVEVRGHSEVPIGAGLGSSASLCIAMIRAVASATGQTIAEDRLAQLGNQLEARFHGRPSGLDTAVVAYEKCISFRKGHTPTLITTKTPPQWQFALIDTNIRASTLSMIRIAEPFFRGRMGDRRLNQFESLADEVEIGLEHGHPYQVGEALRICNRLLSEAGVVPETLQEMIRDCEKLGVLAAKITGAGGGGTILCLLRPESAHEDYLAIQQHFKKNKVYKAQLP